MHLLLRFDRSFIDFLFAENEIVEALESSSESEFSLSNVRFDVLTTIICGKRDVYVVSTYLFTTWFERMSYACVSEYS
jgi:hypothetical protein